MKNKLVLLIMQSSKQQRGKRQDQTKVWEFISKAWEMVVYKDLNLHPLGKRHNNSYLQQHHYGFRGQTALFTFPRAACPTSPRRGPQL